MKLVSLKPYFIFKYSVCTTATWSSPNQSPTNMMIPKIGCLESIIGKLTNRLKVKSVIYTNLWKKSWSTNPCLEKMLRVRVKPRGYWGWGFS